MEDIQTVKSGIEKLLLELNYDLSVFNFKKKNGGNVLEIVIDSIDPISMEDIVNVSEKISTYLDEHDFTTSNYTLDVSSLGAEKPIDVAKIDKYIGKYISVHLNNPINGENYYEGDLLASNESVITIEIRIKTRKKKIEIEKGNISSCKLAIKF